MVNTMQIERETQKLEKRLCRQVGQAIVQYNMIEEGDKVMVCMSGGKDSYGMLDILLKLKARAPIHFDIIAVNLDQKQPGFPAHVLPDYLSTLGVPFRIETQDTYAIVKSKIPEGKTMCSLCSRLRRGILYRVADEIGATKIVLCHHRDDSFCSRARFRALGRAPRISHHPLHFVRQPRRLTTPASGQYAARVGEKTPRAFGHHVQFLATRGALAPAGPQFV